MKASVWMFLGVAGLAATATTVLPRGMAAVDLLTGPRDEEAAANYVLAGKTTADYHVAAEQALAAKDDDLAASIAALAGQRQVSLPPDLSARIEAAQEDARSRMGEDAWNGFLSGSAPNEAALAGAVASDLMGAGDLRDLFQQAGHYLAGEEVDVFTIGLATVGLGLTAATAASVGLTLPERAGVSTLKAVTRAGRLSPLLAHDVGRMAASALDGGAISLLKPGAAEGIKALGMDTAMIGRNAGYRATLETLRTAKSAEEVSGIARLSGRFGKATRGVLALGGAGLTFLSFATSATAWTLSLLAWVVAALYGVAKLGFRLGRWLWPRPAPALQRA